MMKRLILPGLVTLLFFGCAGTSSFPVNPEMARLEASNAEWLGDLAMAELACAIQRSVDAGLRRPSIRCSDDGAWTLLSINHSQLALTVIAQLAAQKMDAGLSESRACVILQRGQEVLPHFEKLDAVAAHKACEVQWARVSVNVDPPLYPDVKVDDICNSVQDIERLRNRAIKDIEAGKSCWPWDFYD
ncbi:MAG: hypothetical protein LBP58_04015 [Azoarcus sp.]|jgi:hypothetical protein|nr:hypothetical protein [Azoarcus sp.]